MADAAGSGNGGGALPPPANHPPAASRLPTGAPTVAPDVTPNGEARGGGAALAGGGGTGGGYADASGGEDGMLEAFGLVPEDLLPATLLPAALLSAAGGEGGASDVDADRRSNEALLALFERSCAVDDNLDAISRTIFQPLAQLQARNRRPKPPTETAPRNRHTAAA